MASPYQVAGLHVQRGAPALRAAAAHKGHSLMLEAGWGRLPQRVPAWIESRAVGGLSPC